MGDPLAHIADPTLERLSAFLDGDLDAADKADVERELSAAPELQAALEAMRRSQGMIRQHGGARAPEGFADRVLEAVDHEPVPISRARGWRRPMGVPIEIWALAAAAIFVIAVGLRAKTMEFGGSPDLHDDPSSPAAAPPSEKKADTKKDEPEGEPQQGPRVQSMAPVINQGTLNTAGNVDNTGNTGDLDNSGTAEVANTAGIEPTNTVLPTQMGTPTVVGELKSMSYEIKTSDEDAPSKLNRLALSVGGKLTAVTASDGSPAYWVEIPSGKTLQFEQELKFIGTFHSNMDPKNLTVGDTVKMFLQVEMVDEEPKPASKPSRKTSTDHK